MDKTENKISMRQFFIIYIIAMSALMIRLLPRYSSYFAKEGTWISALIGVVFIYLLIYILHITMRKGKDTSFAESFERILGKTGAKILLFLYLVACIWFLSFKIRYFAEKCMTSIFTELQIEFFIMSVLFVAYLIVRNNIQGFARFSEFIWVPILLFIGGVLFLTAPSIKLSNLYPVTLYDIDNIFMGTLPISMVFVYLPCMLFLGENIADKEKFLKTGIIYMSVASLMGTSIVLTTVGAFGTELSQVLTQPYFTALKDIEILKALERIEALAITFWIVTDIVLIVILVYVIITLIKKVFNLKDKKNMIIPVLFLEYILSMYIASNMFELEYYSRGIGAIIYMLFGIGIPIMVFLVGKLRKVI